MKKVFTLILCICILLTQVTAYAESYTDVGESHWASSAINEFAGKGILKGYSDGTFKPNGNVTIGEFMKMFTLAVTGVDSGNAKSGHWARNYYNHAEMQGYTDQSSVPATDLDRPITRREVALTINRYLGVYYKPTTKLMEFSDVSSNLYEYDAIRVLASLGVMSGYKDKTFKPNGSLTRAEAAVILERLFDTTKRVRTGIEMMPEIDSMYSIANLFDVDKYLEQLTNDGLYVSPEYILNNASICMPTPVQAYDGKTCVFNANLSDDVYLVKDNQIVAKCKCEYIEDASLGNAYNRYTVTGYNLADADTILSFSKADTDVPIHAIANPFR